MAKSLQFFYDTPSVQILTQITLYFISIYMGVLARQKHYSVTVTLKMTDLPQRNRAKNYFKRSHLIFQQVILKYRLDKLLADFKKFLLIIKQSRFKLSYLLFLPVHLLCFFTQQFHTPPSLLHGSPLFHSNFSNTIYSIPIPSFTAVILLH